MFPSVAGVFTSPELDLRQLEAESEEALSINIHLSCNTVCITILDTGLKPKIQLYLLDEGDTKKCKTKLENSITNSFGETQGVTHSHEEGQRTEGDADLNAQRDNTEVRTHEECC